VVDDVGGDAGVAWLEGPCIRSLNHTLHIELEREVVRNCGWAWLVCHVLWADGLHVLWGEGGFFVMVWTGVVGE